MTNAPITKLLVLGGGSDIAIAFISRLEADGLSDVVLAGRPGGTRDETGLSAALVDFDAADTAGHAVALASIDREHGPFDTVLVAFGQLGEPFTLDIEPGVAADLAHVNYTGAVSSCLASINILRGEPNARLIVLSSIAAVRPRIGNIVYGSAKAGLDAFATAISAPAKSLGVEVITVRPGFVHTRMTDGLEPAPFATTADEVAADMVAGIAKGRSIIHSPAPLGPVGFVLRNLPGPIWRRVSQR